MTQPTQGQRVLLDTGPFVALLSKSDQHHGRCVQAAKTLALPLYTCWPVITEAMHLLRRAGGDPRDILSLVMRRRVEFLLLDRADLNAIDSILERYADQTFSLADASLMHLAERESIDVVFTVDQKDFSVFRTETGKALTLIGAREA